MRKSTMLSLLFVAVSAVVPGGCTCIARDAETYKNDTRSLLETRNKAIKDCYDVALTTDPKLDGEVVVNFTVEKKTGKIIDTRVDPNRTKAPESLSKCIVEAIDGLILDPVDQRDGQATFTWRFRANEPKPAEEEEAPPAA
ncbi:MAG TPA: AgmX/PglI C-terminal domain-containing protein [Nannocystis sp.]